MFIIFILFLQRIVKSFCGDGIGNTLIKVMSTTTPLRRPQKLGYFLNVHEVEPLEYITENAIRAGLNSNIDRLQENLESYFTEVLEGSKLQNLESAQTLSSGGSNIETPPDIFKNGENWANSYLTKGPGASSLNPSDSSGAMGGAGGGGDSSSTGSASGPGGVAAVGMAGQVGQIKKSPIAPDEGCNCGGGSTKNPLFVKPVSPECTGCVPNSSSESKLSTGVNKALLRGSR